MLTRLSTAIIVALLTVYAAAALQPFNWKWPTTPNLAGRGDGKRLIFPGPGVVQSQAPPPWITTAKELQHLEIGLQIRSFSDVQEGPARIFTISRDPYRRNLTIAQDRKDLIVRLRTPWTDLNGMPAHRVTDVFQGPRWKDIRVFIAPGQLKIEVDGELSYARSLPKAPLANWDTSYLLAIGNELTHDRNWQGELGQASIRVGYMRKDYVSPQALVVPSVLWRGKAPKLIPFKDLAITDAALNFLGFIPLGFFLALRVLGKGQRPKFAILSFIALTSLSLESLQMCLPDRFTSIDDLLLNTAGGAVGMFLLHVRMVARRRRRADS